MTRSIPLLAGATLCLLAQSPLPAVDAPPAIPVPPPAPAKWTRPAGWDALLAAWEKAGGDWSRIPDVKAAVDKHRCPKPTEFAIVFSLGYTTDLLPVEDAKFEQLLIKAKAAGFNVVHTFYTPERLELCRKHGVKMMIDFLHLTRHHVYLLPDKCRAVCKAVEGDPAVWGYNIWNDHFGGRDEGRQRDIRNVRLWDPSHGAYCGSCANDDDPMLPNADCLGYYDFHWERGIAYHFPHLAKFLTGARQHDSYLVTLISGRPTRRYGRAADYLHRSLWSVNTSIAFGLKGYSWFLAPMDPKTLEWTANSAHIIPVNLSVAPLTTELMKIGLPSAVYATRITRSNENQGPGGPIMPPGLETHAFPADFWLQPTAGEFIMGVFQDDRKRDAVYLANYNSQAPQAVTLKLGKPLKPFLFNRQTRQWQPLTVTANTFALTLDAGGGELIRFEP